MSSVDRIGALALAALLALTAPAAADEAGRRAVTLGREAMALFEDGRYAEAHARFAEAEGLVHSPVFLLYMARSKRATGELLEAAKRYRAILAEPLSPDPPEPWRRAHVDASNELGALEARIPTLVVEGSAAALFVDDAPVTVPAQPMRVDPGRHTIVARDREGRERREVVEIAEGQTRRVVLHFAEDEGPVWPGALLLALGVGGISVGTITGIIAKVEADDIKSRCIGNDCLAVDADRAETARALATTSTASLVAGGALAAAGVVLLVIRPGGEDAPVAIDLSPRGLAFRAHF